MKSSDWKVVVCEMCGCRGNCECGHESLNKRMGCTLDAVLVCPCCNACMGHEGYAEPIREEQRKEDADIVKKLQSHEGYISKEMAIDAILNSGKET